MLNLKARLLILLLPSLFLTQGVGQVFAQSSKPLTMEGKTALYQKVLAIPGSKLYSEIDAPADTADDVKPFSIFYVYSRQSSATGDWLQV